MTFPKEHQKIALAALIAALVFLNGYHYFTREEQKTAPLVYPRGAVASTPLRQGPHSRTGGTDPLSLIIERQEQAYPGVSRDIFRMERSAAKPVTRPVPTVMALPLPPLPPERPPEEIAADRAREDLAKFRYLGYLTERENTLFLSKDGELFIVKIGEKVLNTYTVKAAGRDGVVLLDTATGVERRIEMTGDGTQAPPQHQRPLQHAPPQLPQPSRPKLQPPQPPQTLHLKQQQTATHMQPPDPQQAQPQMHQPAKQQTKPWLQKRRLHNLKQLEKKAGTAK